MSTDIDTDIEKAAQAWEQATAETPPVIEPVPDGAVTLLRGVQADDGSWAVDAEVRELTGDDEEFIGKWDWSAQPLPAFITTLLSRAVERIGPLTGAEAASAVDQLITGDRDLLFMGVVRATYGNEKKLHGRCPACDAPNDITLQLDADFPVKSDLTEAELRSPSIEVPTRIGMVELRLLTGEGQEWVYRGRARLSTPEVNTRMLAWCAVSVDGRLVTDKEEWARSLPLSVRRTLVDVLVRRAPQVPTEGVKVPCASCGVVNDVPVDWASLLLD